MILSANLTIKIFWYAKGGARSTKPASGFMKRACVLVSLWARHPYPHCPPFLPPQKKQQNNVILTFCSQSTHPSMKTPSVEHTKCIRYSNPFMISDTLKIFCFLILKVITWYLVYKTKYIARDLKVKSFKHIQKSWWHLQTCYM